VVFRSRGWIRIPRRAQIRASTLSPSSRVSLLLILAGSRDRQLLSWTSLPYGTNQVQRSTTGRFPRLPAFRLQGLFTLLTAYSLQTLVGMRCTHRAHGISPSELDLLAGLHGVTAVLSPPAVSLANDTMERAPRTASQAAAPGHLPLHGSAGSTLNQSTPLGFTFLGFYRPPALIHPLGGSPLMCLASATTQSTVACTSGYQSARDW
jgi:hypothetical protein